MNIERHNAIIKQIKDNPETWDQTTWHCNTAHCYAGWAQIHSGAAPNAKTVRRDARVWLDLNFDDANYLFSMLRTVSDLSSFMPGVYSFNRYGLDRDGFDRDGFNRYGLDRDGFNRDGFDIDGLDINNKPRRSATT